MPKIEVTEKDLSWYMRQRGEGALTVLVPGMSTFGPSSDEGPVLCNSTNFARTFGGAVPGIENYSYQMAESYIKAGFNVLFLRFISAGAAAATCSQPIGVVEEATRNCLSISAKYKGSFGNKLVVKVRKTASDKLVLQVYSGSEFLETHIVSLNNFNDKNYYTNFNSDFIKIEVEGEVSKILESFSGDEISVTFSGGLDCSNDATAESVVSEIYSAMTTLTAFSDLEDPLLYSFDVITSAGWCEHSKELEIDPLDNILHKLAMKRGTAIYLVDGGSDMDHAEFYSYCEDFNSSYAVGIGPWGYAKLLSDGRTVLLPGSYAFLVKWAQSCSEGLPSWVIPAGVKRSTLGSFYESTKYPVGKAVLESWQNHETVTPGDYKVNPIMKVKNYGYVIYGNSTLLHNKLDGSTSMLQSLSVRVLCNLIKSLAFEISLSLQFDQMTSDLFLQFKTLLRAQMDQLVYQNALYDYDIVVEPYAFTRTDLNEKRVPVTIRISPTPAAENFEISLEVSQAGVSFTNGEDETL